jgi:hypothetical protein
MMIHRIYLYTLLLIPAAVQTLPAQEITFSNSGKLYIKDSLYIHGSFRAVENSEICLEGKTRLTGHFINDVSSGHVFTTVDSLNAGAIEFAGTSRQYIRGTAAREHYINFPKTLLINNTGTTADSVVWMNPNMAATVRTVDVRRGRLVLDSEAKADATLNAHLLVRDGVTNRPNGVQVNLAMGDNWQHRKLTGFTPPFKTLYADYFFYNFLSRPSAKGLFGNDGQLITNPRTPLKAGQGYILGMGVIPDGDPYYTADIDPRWKDALYTRRATTKFTFCRPVAEPSFSQYLNEQVTPDYLTGEQLIVDDLPIALEKGFNYLGNPYMAPLDLTDVIQGTTADWGVPDGTLRKGFYVLSNGTGSYANGRFTFNATYLISQEQGSTHDSRSVAPMQMFIVGADTPVTLTIPKSRRRHDPSATFLRSTQYQITDELLIQTTDLATGGYDRLCILFREGATQQSGDPFDAPKIFNRSGGVNQISLPSADSKDLAVSAVPPTIDRLNLRFTPSLTPQQVTLTASRLQSLLSVAEITLEDAQTGALVNLKQTPAYTFASSPSDNPERFILHLTPAKPATTAEQSAPPKLRAEYTDGLIRIYGLKDNDRGSHLSLYTMQGQLLDRRTVTQTEPCLLRHKLPKGIYMLKTNTATLKFPVR